MREVDHKAFLCKTLWKFQTKRMFTDFTIVSGDGEGVPIHRAMVVGVFKLWGIGLEDREEFECLIIPDVLAAELVAALRILYLHWDSKPLYSLLFSGEQGKVSGIELKEESIAVKEPSATVKLFDGSDDEEVESNYGSDDQGVKGNDDFIDEPFEETELETMEKFSPIFTNVALENDEVKPTRKRGRPKGKKDSSKRKVYNFECNDCELEFKGRLAYKKHLRKYHDLPAQKNSMTMKVQTPCPHCDIVLSNGHAFHLHIALVHREKAHLNPEIIFKKKCTDCNEKFFNSQDLDKHTRSIHGKNHRSWRCNFCKEVFPTKPSLRSHRLLLHKEEISESGLSGIIKNVPCPYCDKMLTSKSAVNLHITKAHSEKLSLHPEIQFNYACHLCQQNFYGKGDFIAHNAAHHGQEFQCDFCDQSFKTKGKRTTHMDALHKDEKHLCEKCSKVFKTKHALAAHIKWVHAQGSSYKFPCSSCKQGAQSQEGLERHVESNHRGKQYLCAFCEAAFSDTQGRSIHERSMHGEKDLSCEHCDMKFSLKIRLTRHIKNVHVKEKDKVCPECGEKFFNLNTFRCHVNRHSDTRPFACEVCGQCYLTNRDLKNHRRVHTVPYKCKLCERRFSSKDCLDDHLRKHAGEKMDCRFLCGSSYLDRRNRDRHEKSCATNENKGYTFSYLKKE